ncbi:MAG: hypothetical protein ACO29T_05080 [Steroidobacteraceae bacterium]
MIRSSADALLPLMLGVLITFGGLARLGGLARADGVTTPATASSSKSLASTHDDFCGEVQRRLVATRLSLRNVIEADFESFKLSKPGIDPLRTHQFVARNASGMPVGVSCKTKSADHLRSVHGASAAADPDVPAHQRSCRDLHREMIREIVAQLSPAERALLREPPQQVMLDADVLRYTGSQWVKSSAEAYRGEDGRLHLRASALFAEWEDWRWKLMPESWRGNHYCHLVAPEHIRALMRGETR